MKSSNDHNLESASAVNAPENYNSTDAVGHKARPTAAAPAASCGSGFTPDNPAAPPHPATPPRTKQSRSVPSDVGRDDLRVVRPAPQPQPNVTPNTTVAGVVLSDEALAKLDDPVHSASPPAYTFTPRVLDRWSRQNLHYTPDEETGGGQAQFRFHGSTCGNIEFDLLYHVKVGSSTDGWPILAQHCEPAPHGDGHTRMCCWRESSTMVEDWMTREAPLLNQPLSNALTWAPAKSASGCLCHVDGRMHKWNAVLQTLHFALSKNTNPS